MSVGEILQRTRLHYGQSPEDVERAIRVRAEQIIDIERNGTDSLPGHVYAIGFVRAYSEYLGLDGDKMVASFRAQQGGDNKKTRLDFLIPTSDGKLPSKWIVWLSVFLVMAGPYTIWALSGGEQYKGMEIKAVPEEMRQQNADSIMNLGALSQGREAEGIPVKNEVLLNIVESTWVEIKDGNGDVLVSKTLESGEQYYVPNDKNLKITIGDGGAVEYQLADGSFVAFERRGKAVRNVPLNLRPDLVRVKAAHALAESESIPGIEALQSVEAAPSSPVVDTQGVEDIPVAPAVVVVPEVVVEEGRVVDDQDDLSTDDETVYEFNQDDVVETQEILFDRVPLPPKAASQGKGDGVLSDDVGVPNEPKKRSGLGAFFGND